ncbi:MAG: M42 family metallopeptidase [Armatimonadota bacterium]
MELLKELCEAAGIPGREERLRAIVRRELEPLVDELRVDALGNLIAVRRGSSGKKLAIAAHMDEIGFLVTYIEEESGFLRLNPVGGHDPRNMVAQRVKVVGKQDLPGVLYPGQKPPHLLDGEDKNKTAKVSEFFVDLGLPVKEVRELVPIGSMVVIDRPFAEIGHCVSCKAMDNRVSVFVMIEALRKAKRSGFEVYALATVQEEVGLRGVLTATYAVEPDVALALDITIAADIPGVPEHERVTCVGNGTAIKIMDSASISNARMVEVLRELALRREIPHQMEILPRGGTDAGGMQRVRAGAPACTVSIPARYVHTSIELCAKRDIEATIDLVAAFIEEGHGHDYLPR